MVHTSTQVWEHDASGWHQSGSCSCCLFSLPDERQGGNYRRTSTRNSAECECVGLTIMVSVWVCEMCFKWSGVMGRGGELRYIALCWVELSWVELNWVELSSLVTSGRVWGMLIQRFSLFSPGTNATIQSIIVMPSQQVIDQRYCLEGMCEWVSMQNDSITVSMGPLKYPLNLALM